MDRTLRPGLFGIDDIPDELYGYTYGDTWNGLACPYFSRQEGLRLVAFWQSVDNPTIVASYDDATDTFSFLTDGMEAPETFTSETHTIYGQPVTLYPIGNGVWCWDEV